MSESTATVQFKSTEKDPRFVAVYRIAIASENAFEATLLTLGDLLIGNDRQLESLRRLSLYLGTLFHEVHAAGTQLSFMEMPRAQYILNRQLVEYYARNRWFIDNKDAALRELDLLPKTVHKEVENNKGAFDRIFDLPSPRTTRNGRRKTLRLIWSGTLFQDRQSWSSWL